MIKNVADFDTAKTLFEKGFTQPAPEPGQFWWRKNPRSKAKSIEVIQSVEVSEADWKDSEPRCYMVPIGEDGMNGTWHRVSGLQKEGYLFAPTAMDICHDTSPILTVAQDSFGGYNGGVLRWNGFDIEFSEKTAVGAAAGAWVRRQDMYSKQSNAFVTT